MAFIDKNSPILVTGASGFIASWIIKYLLEDGHTVHATVRDQSNKKKIQHLLEIEKEAPGKLVFFNANLLNAGEFDEAAKGCEVVIHTASPFITQGVKDAQKQLIEPALNGTRNVLKAANNAGSVKRVVLTSSVAAVYSDNKDIQSVPNGVFTEANWNTTSDLKHNAYSYSKTLAEREAWKMQKNQDQWSLTTINPGFVLGPSLTTRKDSASISTMMQLGNGTFKSGAPELYFGMVDVRDVAKAHIIAAMNNGVSGRHIMVADTKSFLDIAEVLRSEFGDNYAFPKSILPKLLVYLVGPFMGISWKYSSKNIGYKIKFDNSYAKKDLGIKFRDLKTTFSDQFNQLLNDGLIEKK